MQVASMNLPAEISPVPAVAGPAMAAGCMHSPATPTLGPHGWTQQPRGAGEALRVRLFLMLTFN